MVRRLRAAGAIVIGKTNLPELAFAMFTESPTWGVTRNPWNTERVPGGSSGGSGAAVAAGLAAAATASDGAGSIRYPAAYCSLFGLKPQRGRVPLDPNLEQWHGMSVNGCLTHTRPRHGALSRRHRRRRPRARQAPAARAPLRRGRPDLARKAAGSRLGQGHPRAGAPDAGRALPARRRGDRPAARLARPRGDLARPGVGNGGQRRHDPLLARRRRRRPPASQPRAAWPAGARRRPPGLSGPRRGPAAHQGGDLRSTRSGSIGSSRTTTSCCFRWSASRRCRSRSGARGAGSGRSPG